LSTLADPVEEEERHHLGVDHPPINPEGRPEKELRNPWKHLAEEDQLLLLMM
jgi:hypothetical protein